MKSDVIKTPIEISKELEIINFRNLLLKNNQKRNKKDDFVAFIKKGRNLNKASKKNKVSPETNKAKKTNEPMTQLAAFQQAMKFLLITGQMLGLNPVKGILETEVANVRFKIFSWRFLHCILIGIAQAVVTTLCFYWLLKGSLSITVLSYVSFFAATCITTFLFIQIGSKWPTLIKDLLKCSLDEYVDPRIKIKCYVATVTVLSLALVEHFLSIFYKLVHIVNCSANEDLYAEFLKYQFPWYFELKLSRNMTIDVLLQILNIISTVNWNYSDLFIVCISMYLTSILNQINEKIKAASTKHYLPTSYWRALREDYNRATRLVRSFDDIFSGIVFTSFATNLFFVCLQLFHILAYGLGTKQYSRHSHICENQSNGLLGEYLYNIYLLFSAIYLFARSITVSLMAARVNTASLVPAPALYNVPSSAYCDEVARFITQVNEDNIALSGLQFFYVTRDLVLTVAGTIVTYELVLLQFSSQAVGK